MRYELFYLVGASKEAELEKTRSDVNEIITGQGGVFEEKETLEKRRLAYEIKHETHGIYIAQRFELEREKIKDVISKLNLYVGVLRFTISRASELPELKSKEERIAEAQAVPKEREAKEREAVEAKKDKEAEPKEVEPKEAEEEKPESQEDMDKKLEEILNI